MSCLVPSCARAKFNFSPSRSGRTRSLGERFFLVLVVLRSGSFLSLKLSFLVPGHSGSLVIEFVLEQKEKLILSAERSSVHHIRL